MIPAPSQVELRTETREALKIFLDTPYGQNFLEALNAYCPEILREGTAENQLAAANRHAGFEDCLGRILFFVEPTPPEDDKPAPGSYPPLDDEERWSQEAKSVAAKLS